MSWAIDFGIELSITSLKYFQIRANADDMTHTTEICFDNEFCPVLFFSGKNATLK